MSNDLISREALKAEITLMFGDKTHITESVCELIDNAPTVTSYTLEDLEKAKNNGYKWGRIDGKKERPQLRLMTVEECAGHTIDYAMGWKACIEWIKGGAE